MFRLTVLANGTETTAIEGEKDSMSVLTHVPLRQPCLARGAPIFPPSKILPLFFALFFQPNSSSARFCPPLPSSCFLLPRIRGSLLGWSSAREISPSRAAKNWKVVPVCRFLSKAVEVIAELMHRKQGGGQSLFLQMCEKKEEKKKRTQLTL